MSVISTVFAAGIFHAAIASGNVLQLHIPATASGASIQHTTSFSSFSFEPAFWWEFFGNATLPNNFTFGALQTIVKHGGQPNIRPGGITMDSMIFDPSAGDPVRTTNPKGGIYRTTVGPAYYESWDNFPSGTKFTSTLNFGNDSLDIARNLAVASVKYQAEKVEFFELGNEPTNYPPARWDNSTAAYVAQWLNWTSEIDTAVQAERTSFTNNTDVWWASSATTDITPLKVTPADIIPDGIDSTNQVAEYSIHSYAFATCDPARSALATTPNLLNHTGNVLYADEEIVPSAQAALNSGKPWIIGEFNSIACSGQPNVSDTFAQALWTVDTELIYAVRNASAVYLHQGATLVFQSSQQSNTAGDDGSPGYSTYDFLYPRTSSKRGEQRILPGFSGLLFVVEAFARSGTRVRALETPEGISEDYFSSYAFYDESGSISKLALINMRPYFSNSTEDYSVEINVAQPTALGRFWVAPRAWVKRLTAPFVDEKDAGNVTWAGQTFEQGVGQGEVVVEEVGPDGVVKVRGSEAVLVFFDEDEAFGREMTGKSAGPWWKFW